VEVLLTVVLNLTSKVLLPTSVSGGFRLNSVSMLEPESPHLKDLNTAGVEKMNPKPSLKSLSVGGNAPAAEFPQSVESEHLN
jgi:hypothetical protein